MNISSAIFECSAPSLDACPDESLPEFAFIGRSNVGKSSLINMLSAKPNMARVSPVPGFTKLMNFFIMNNKWRLVDLPGYGFAQTAKKTTSQFNEMVSEYMVDRPNLCCVFVLLDSGLAPQPLDLEFVEWLVRNSVPFVLVFTKTDKVAGPVVQSNIDAFMAEISGWFVKPPVSFRCSSVTRQGREELLGVVEESINAIEGRTTPGTKKKPQGQELRKKRPDRNRPW